MMPHCQNQTMTQWCDNQDVCLVQMRSQAAGPHGTNRFEGERLYLCKGCRKALSGTFKRVTSTSKGGR